MGGQMWTEETFSELLWIQWWIFDHRNQASPGLDVPVDNWQSKNLSNLCKRNPDTHTKHFPVPLCESSYGMSSRVRIINWYRYLKPSRTHKQFPLLDHKRKGALGRVHYQGDITPTVTSFARKDIYTNGGSIFPPLAPHWSLLTERRQRTNKNPRKGCDQGNVSVTEASSLIECSQAL